jgi:hypothetical protein
VVLGIGLDVEARFALPGEGYGAVRIAARGGAHRDAEQHVAVARQVRQQLARGFVEEQGDRRFRQHRQVRRVALGQVDVGIERKGQALRVPLEALGHVALEQADAHRFAHRRRPRDGAQQQPAPITATRTMASRNRDRPTANRAATRARKPMP